MAPNAPHWDEEGDQKLAQNGQQYWHKMVLHRYFDIQLSSMGPMRAVSSTLSCQII